MLKQKKSVIIAISLTSFLSILLWYFWDEFATQGYAPYQETYSNWGRWEERANGKIRLLKENKNEEDRPGVDLRREKPSAGKLLLKHLASSDAYSYNPETKEIQLITQTEWQQAEGNISSCNRLGSIPPDNNPVPTEKLKRSGATVSKAEGAEIYAQYVIDVRNSPQSNKQAIISAYGPKGLQGISILPGLGGSGEATVYGRRYIQIFDLKSGKFIDKPIRLNAFFAYPSFHLCWSEEEEFVVTLELSYAISSYTEHSFSVIDARDVK